jgi:anti-sigma factor RsiW
MTCRQFVPDVIDYARGIVLDPPRQEAVASHLQSCVSCAALVERERAMSAALRRLARSEEVPPQNDIRLGRLLAMFDAPRRPLSRVAVGVGLSLAASILIVVGLSVGWKRDAPPRDASGDAVLPANADAFVVLPGASALPRFESGQVIRVEVPSAGGAITADVLVGQDGLARAVRLVQ